MENSVNINLESDVVTGETVAHFVTSILEFLLYQRNQIPYVCKTFKYLISKWKNENDDGNANENMPNSFQINRQKDLARQTMDCIRNIGEIIDRGFKQSDISRVRFLFGPTAVMPKEAYTIIVPPINRIHSYEHHKLNPVILNQALISLLTSDCLYNTFSLNLSPTNVFLELEMPDEGANGWEQVFSTDLCELPPSCKHVIINLVHVVPLNCVSSKCCKDLSIFDDFASLSVENSSSEKLEEKKAKKITQFGWWEASTIIKGFKPSTVKGNSIWQ